MLCNQNKSNLKMIYHQKCKLKNLAKMLLYKSINK